MKLTEWFLVIVVVGCIWSLGFVTGQVYHHGRPEAEEWEAAPCSCFDAGDPDCFV